jgi:hypothetical protein
MARSRPQKQAEIALISVAVTPAAVNDERDAKAFRFC